MAKAVLKNLELVKEDGIYYLEAIYEIEVDQQMQEIHVPRFSLEKMREIAVEEEKK